MLLWQERNAKVDCLQSGTGIVARTVSFVTAFYYIFLWMNFLLPPQDAYQLENNKYNKHFTFGDKYNYISICILHNDFVNMQDGKPSPLHIYLLYLTICSLQNCLFLRCITKRRHIYLLMFWIWLLFIAINHSLITYIRNTKNV